MPEVESELTRRLAIGEELVVATVIRLDGEPPSRAGAKALFDGERQLAGTLGCSEFDSQARADAPTLLGDGAPALRTYRHELGGIEVYLEPYLRRPVLVVLGDTPVASALRRWAPEAGFDVSASQAAVGTPATTWTPCGRGAWRTSASRESRARWAWTSAPRRRPRSRSRSWPAWSPSGGALPPAGRTSARRRWAECRR